MENLEKKEELKKYIKGFSSIKMKNICKILDLDCSNVAQGRTSTENLEKVKKAIEEHIAKLYIN